MNVADIFASVRLNLETGEFEAAAAKTADKTAQSMGQRMSGKLKTALAGGVGAAFGAGLAMALSGAQELDAAVRQLQADTGMTAEEAANAQKSMAALFKTNLQGFDEIGRAMAAVHNDLGLVGDEADAATESFLKFATATGQDATNAVMAFDDVLDAWNLTADDSQAIMDGLIADHQKFGGAIADSQSALAEMAPAMQAANMRIDDGRALLNLFNAAGVDAAKAPAALAKAVKQLKPGQDLNDLIEQIGAIEDPTLRAQAAMDIFGARSGIGLAQAIKPGMTSLADFRISAEEAAGSTAEAAAAIESSFGNKFKLMMKEAQGALAEFGTGFGDLVMVAAMFGPQLTKAMLAGLGGLTGVLTKSLIPKVTAAILATGPGAAIASSAVGTIAGTAMGAAIPIALVAAAGIGIALAFKAIAIDPGLQEQTKEIGTAIGEQIATGTQEELEKDVRVLEKGIADIKALPLGDVLFGDQVKALEADREAVLAEIERRANEAGAAIPVAMAEGMESGRPMWSGKLEDIKTFFGTTMAGVEAAAREAGGTGMIALAQGITAARQAPLDAFDTLKTMLKNAMSPMAEVARIHGQLTSKALAQGLKSGDPAVRAQAHAVAKLAADRLGELAAGGGKAGKAAMAELEKGIKSKIPAVREASLAAKAAAQEKLDALKPQASQAGQNAGSAFASGLKAAVGAGDFKINASVGFRLGGRAAGGPVTEPVWTGEEGPEVFVPEVAGRILSHEDSMAAVSGSRPAAAAQGRDITVNVYNPAPEPASTSTRRELRKLALSGSPT